MVFGVTLPRFAPAVRAVALALTMAAEARATLWVSPVGDDRNPGTEEQPFRTLEHARDAVRALNREMADDITVFLSGEFHLDRPVEFGAEDSGTNGFNIVYTAAPGEHPVLSGGVPITGWAVSDKARNLWWAPAPAALSNTHDLFVNGARASRTRGRLLAVFARDAGANPEAAPDPKVQWRNPDDVVFEPARPNAIWSERTGTAPAFVENAFELLGIPGEWYFDRPARRIYYTPRAGEDMAVADAEAGVAEALVTGIGTKDRPIAGLVFKGIRFDYTGCLEIPDDEPALAAPVGPSGAVHFAYSAHIQFLEDEFLHMSTPALELSLGIADCTVEGCLFGDISWSAVQLVDATGIRIADSRFTWIATGHILQGAIEVDHSDTVGIEHVQIDHVPTRGILVRSAKPGGVREESNLVAPPLIGFHGAAPGAAAAAEGDGISQDYHWLAEERLGTQSIPKAPTDVSADAEDTFAYVTWTPSPEDGGEPVDSYTVISSFGAKVMITAAAFQEKGYVQISDLANGHPVSFTVTATNGLGASPPSLPTANITPWHKKKLKAPAAPAAVSFVTGKTGTTVEITQPASNGGSPIISYAVSAGPETTPILVEGLDVIHADAAHPVTRSLAGFAPAPGSPVSVAAQSVAGDGKPAVVVLQPAPRPAQTPKPGL
jgi:hypothetical protein